jgi:hypothetical protein
MGKSIYTHEGKPKEGRKSEGSKSEKRETTSSQSLSFSSRRDINDMKNFIRFDKLENYSCDGTRPGPSTSLCVIFSHRPHFHSALLCASTRKVKNLCSFTFLILFTATSCFPPGYCTQTKTNPWGGNEQSKVIYFFITLHFVLLGSAGGEKVSTRFFSFKWIWQ